MMVPYGIAIPAELRQKPLPAIHVPSPVSDKKLMAITGFTLNIKLYIKCHVLCIVYKTWVGYFYPQVSVFLNLKMAGPDQEVLNYILNCIDIDYM